MSFQFLPLSYGANDTYQSRLLYMSSASESLARSRARQTVVASVYHLVLVLFNLRLTRERIYVLSTIMSLVAAQNFGATPEGTRDQASLGLLRGM